MNKNRETATTTNDKIKEKNYSILYVGKCSFIHTFDTFHSVPGPVLGSGDTV